MKARAWGLLPLSPTGLQCFRKKRFYRGAEAHSRKPLLKSCSLGTLPANGCVVLIEEMPAVEKHSLGICAVPVLSLASLRQAWSWLYIPCPRVEEDICPSLWRTLLVQGHAMWHKFPSCSSSLSTLEHLRKSRAYRFWNQMITGFCALEPKSHFLCWQFLRYLPTSDQITFFTLDQNPQ